MLMAIPYPDWIKPEIIPDTAFRWYGLMYVIAFAVAYIFSMIQIKERKLDTEKDHLWVFFFWGIVGMIIGARIFGTLVYSGSDKTYWAQPWLIFWPFSIKTPGVFTGFTGVSYHGGLIGAIVATLIYARVKKLDYLEIGDIVCAAIPFGYTFGRIGNFINAELYGRVTTFPLGMIFPHLPESEKFPASESWVVAMANKTGVAVNSMRDLVNLPRHPSQLYEALFEGIVLGCALWFWARKRKPFKGFVIGAYLIGYGLIRFFLEYLRAPDAWMGYALNFSGKKDLPLDRFITPWAFSTGQVFCFLMIAGGSLLIYALASNKKKTEAMAFEAEAHKKKADPRKLRKKIR
jgi:phosphatidylglycerol---prolipoprotein diacylglyceryl transferase